MYCTKIVGNARKFEINCRKCRKIVENVRKIYLLKCIVQKLQEMLENARKFYKNFR